MKRMFSLLLSGCLLLTGCGVADTKNEDVDLVVITEELAMEEPMEALASVASVETVQFSQLSDPSLLTYMEGELYQNLVETLDSEDYFVENVSAIYYSKEYLEEVAYNTQENIYFGYTLSELADAFQGTQFVFTVDESGETVVQSFEGYDDTYDQVIANVATGAGVILVCVTVSTLTAGVAPAVSMVLAISAKTGTMAAVSGGALSSVVAGAVTGMTTGDMDEAGKAAVLAGSEGFKWGAITGALTGGVGEAIALKGASLNGLTINQAAQIQRESHYPLSIIKQFNSMDEYYALKNAGVTAQTINGKTVLVQAIDLDYTGGTESTNLQRMLNGNAPLDEFGSSYELHHLGQSNDATLAILTSGQHDLIPNMVTSSTINRSAFATIRKNFWMTFAEETVVVVA